MQYARDTLHDEHAVLFAHRYITRPSGAGGENHVALTAQDRSAQASRAFCDDVAESWFELCHRNRNRFVACKRTDRSREWVSRVHRGCAPSISRNDGRMDKRRTEAPRRPACAAGPGVARRNCEAARTQCASRCRAAGRRFAHPERWTARKCGRAPRRGAGGGEPAIIAATFKL